VYVFRSTRQAQGLSRTELENAVKQESGVLVRLSDRYPERFRNFSEHFHHPLFQLPYPLDVFDQCMPVLFATDRLQFLTLNSSWQVDEYFRKRAGINRDAFDRGLRAAENQIAQGRQSGALGSDDVLRIAVCHHPVTGQERIMDDAFLERLARLKFKLFMHGHIHEIADDTLLVNRREWRLHVLGAGTCDAPASARPESMPRLYYLLEISRDLRSVTVIARAKQRVDGAWGKWAVWPGASTLEGASFYTIDLTS
jgi:hypothetical protein